MGGKIVKYKKVKFDYIGIYIHFYEVWIPIFVCFIFREKNSSFHEEWKIYPILHEKVFDCTRRAVIGWKGKV